MTKMLERTTTDGGEQRQPHIIDPELCERCALCVEVCKFDATIVK
jgi:NAD-dependent dihydropyrimidine dehydrogenase PreA subunit